MLFPVLGFAQFKTNEAGQLYYEEVFEVPGMDQETIKYRVNEWIAVSYNDANNVIKMNTDDRIVVNGLFIIQRPYENTFIDHKINYSLISDFKDNKYKLLVNNIAREGYPITDVEQPSFEEWKKEYEESQDEQPSSLIKVLGKWSTSEKKLRKIYEEGIESQRFELEGVKSRIAGIVRDIESYVQEGSEGMDDW